VDARISEFTTLLCIRPNVTESNVTENKQHNGQEIQQCLDADVNIVTIRSAIICTNLDAKDHRTRNVWPSGLSMKPVFYTLCSPLYVIRT